MLDEPVPLFRKRVAGGGLFRALVPVEGVRGIPLLTVEMGMNPSAIRVVDPLAKRVGLVPVAPGRVPERLETRRQAFGWTRVAFNTV